MGKGYEQADKEIEMDQIHKKDTKKVSLRVN
jgi:hypothetical protein